MITKYKFGDNEIQVWNSADTLKLYINGARVDDTLGMPALKMMGILPTGERVVVDAKAKGLTKLVITLTVNGEEIKPEPDV